MVVLCGYASASVACSRHGCAAVGAVVAGRGAVVVWLAPHAVGTRDRCLANSPGFPRQAGDRALVPLPLDHRETRRRLAAWVVGWMRCRPRRARSSPTSPGEAMPLFAISSPACVLVASGPRSPRPPFTAWRCSIRARPSVAAASSLPGFAIFALRPRFQEPASSASARLAS